MQQTIAVADRLAVAEAKSIDEGPIRATGRVHICLRGPDGRVKDEETVDNLVVTTGRQHIADQMADQGAAAMSHMAIGTGTDANKVTYVADWAAGDGTGAITEAGIFNSASAGDMLCRSVFAVKNKAAGDTLTLTWILTFSA